jgi:hypothetical protein
MKKRAFIAGIHGWPDDTVIDDRWYVSGIYYMEAAISSGLKVCVSEVWKEVSLVEILVGGVWKTVSGSKVLVGGVWKDSL